MDHDDDDDYRNRPPRRSSNEFIKSQERSARASGTDGVGAFAVAQAAPGGRRAGPRIRRTASQRRRARERAGLETAEGGGGGGEDGGGRMRQDVNPEELMMADVEFDEMILEEEEEEALGFWQLDRTDKYICAGIGILVVALIVILAMALS
ncbi:hypothetical protein HJC23_003725 [Cyclotella cryptica]|uniref:Uncharacterized protein n=1 Tax=Cyclotella cryptica TaxID=29204 RepID=A0ABD3QUN1_9STRA|eukprot:CCRYP_002140-RA/>CCRYP_002140-RA protein AED:0.32 eAED:0.32 QI:0/-1/0/1/-1/1/1/0/150